MPTKGWLNSVVFAVFVCVVLVCLSYYFVDRPVAFFVHSLGLRDNRLLKWLTYLPEAFLVLAPFVIVLTFARGFHTPLAHYQQVLQTAAISILITLPLVRILKLLFGRYWPETWTDNNPSLIHTADYGFHPLHYGAAYTAFPSGHATQTVAVMWVFWLAYPKFRWAWSAVCLAVFTGLVGVNYHFVGDTIAGGFLGAFVGTLVTRRFLGPPSKDGPDKACLLGPGRPAVVGGGIPQSTEPGASGVCPSAGRRSRDNPRETDTPSGN